jgi:hypothetical protein
MQWHTTVLIWTLSTLLLLGGCSDSRARRAGSSGEGSHPSPSTPDVPQPTPRPATIQDTLELEGTKEPITASLFDSAGTSLPVECTTYVPQEVVVETLDAESGAAVRFVARFAGKREENAYLQVVFLPAATTEAGARVRVREVAASRGIEERAPDAPRRFEWSLAEYDFTRRTGPRAVMGTVALGRHGGRYFSAVLSYPEDYEEGFVPRAIYILKQWRWKDTGRGL